MKTVEERFKEKVNKKDGPFPKKKACKIHPEIEGTRCYEWTGYCDRDGYGHMDQFLVHRYVYEQKYGKGLGKMLCLHKCDNARCVRLSHLFKGTNEENTQDMIAKGRVNRVVTWEPAKGEANGSNTGNYSYRELGRKVGLNSSYIWSICKNRAWKHLKG